MAARRQARQRVELTRGAYARRGLVAIVFVALAVSLLAIRSTGVIGGPDRVSAHLVNAGGSLADGADVKLRGVIVGKVTSVRSGDDGLVVAELGMRQGQLGHVPANVVARVLPATVFGTSYVDLTTHGEEATEPLHKDAVIPQDSRQRTLELQQALDDIDSLVKTLKPAQLSATLGAVAGALDGRGEQIGGIVDDLDAYLARLQPRLPLLRSDLAKLATNLETVARLAPDALDAVEDSLVTMRTVTDHRQELPRILTAAGSLLGDANAFLARVKPDLTALLRDASIVVGVYHDLRHQAFTLSFAQLREVSAKVLSTIRHGWIDNDVVIQQGTRPHYGPGDCPRFGTARGDNCPEGPH